MIKNEFLVVDKSILPSYFEKVIMAVRLTEENGKSVCDACKEADISRSTFYKYKDKVFEVTREYGKKAILSFKTIDECGVLSQILNAVAQKKANVLTINQDIPIHNIAYINITLDTKDLIVTIYELIKELKNIQSVKEVSLLAFE